MVKFPCQANKKEDSHVWDLKVTFSIWGSDDHLECHALKIRQCFQFLLLFFLFSLFFLLLGAFSRKSSHMMTSASIHNRIDGVHFYLPLLFYKILYPLLLSVFLRLAFSPPLITNTENCFWSILWCNANFYVSFNWWLDFLFHSIPINLNMHDRVQIKLVL